MNDVREDRLWAEVEEALRKAFAGLRSKSGDPMVDHSIEVGRLVRGYPEADAVAIFGGYWHDGLEDLKDRGMTPEKLELIAMRFLGSAEEARLAVRLVEDCSYSDAEYALEKKARKQAACARWLASGDFRVALVKMADVNHNKTRCASVGPEHGANFSANYLAWADPLLAELTLRYHSAHYSAPTTPQP